MLVLPPPDMHPQQPKSTEVQSSSCEQPEKDNCKGIIPRLVGTIIKITQMIVSAMAIDRRIFFIV